MTVERSSDLTGYADIALELIRSDDRSVLGALPDAFDHAALFRPGWVGAWTYWCLLAALAVGVPLLVRALASAADEDESDSTRPSS